jgi:hypothetical protein
MWGWIDKHCQLTIDHNTTFNYERIEFFFVNFKILCNGVNVGIKATKAHLKWIFKIPYQIMKILNFHFLNYVN